MTPKLSDGKTVYEPRTYDFTDGGFMVYTAWKAPRGELCAAVMFYDADGQLEYQTRYDDPYWALWNYADHLWEPESLFADCAKYGRELEKCHWIDTPDGSHECLTYFECKECGTTSSAFLHVSEYCFSCAITRPVFA